MAQTFNLPAVGDTVLSALRPDGLIALQRGPFPAAVAPTGAC